MLWLALSLFRWFGLLYTIPFHPLIILALCKQSAHSVGSCEKRPTICYTNKNSVYNKGLVWNERCRRQPQPTMAAKTSFKSNFRQFQFRIPFRNVSELISKSICIAISQFGCVFCFNQHCHPLRLCHLIQFVDKYALGWCFCQLINSYFHPFTY